MSLMTTKFPVRFTSFKHLILSHTAVNSGIGLSYLLLIYNKTPRRASLTLLSEHE